MDGLKKDDSIQGASDSLGGVYTVDSGVYLSTIDMAYLDKSKGGALGLYLHLKLNTGAIIKNTLWVTSGDAKGNKPYYVTKKGDKAYLPGFNQAHALAGLTVGKEFSDLEPETKQVLVYNYDAKKDIPTKVDALTELIGKQIKVGLIKQIVDKNIQNDSGVYVPSGETREENEIDKLFNAETDQTIIEMKGDSAADLMPKWKDKWTGEVKNKAKGAAKTGAVAGTPVMTPMGGSGTATSSVPPATKSLFN